MMKLLWIILKSVKKEDGRYYVAWPWKDENNKLPKNYELSVERLKSLQKRLKDDPELLQKYGNSSKINSRRA